MASLLVIMSDNAVLFCDNDALLGDDDACSFDHNERTILASSSVVGLAIVTPLWGRTDVSFIEGRRGTNQLNVSSSLRSFQWFSLVTTLWACLRCVPKCRAQYLFLPLPKEHHKVHDLPGQSNTVHSTASP